MYLIQGVFFQNQEHLGIRCHPTEGNVAVLERALIYDMYHGIIIPDPKTSGMTLVGEMSDHYGRSKLANIDFSGNTVAFDKLYIGPKRKPIHYHFTKKEGPLWIGEYQNDDVGRGVTQCIITEVPNDFLSPERAMVILGKKSPHSW